MTDSRRLDDCERPPRRYWTDDLARRLRKSAVMAKLYRFATAWLVPLLLAAAAAIAAAVFVLPWFIPKFLRNAQRRRQYGVVRHAHDIDRVYGWSEPSRPRPQMR